MKDANNRSKLELVPDDSLDRRFKPLVSVVVPAYNEASILVQNLTELCRYMESLEYEYRWELLVVNDGSTDKTGELAEQFSRTRDNVVVLHHICNFGLGQSLKYAFGRCRGKYVVTMDLDLSYSPDHIERLLRKMRDTRARIVLASPYMAGGQISNIPWSRRILSRWANRFLAATSDADLATLTGMVRAYDGEFLRSLNLRAMGTEVNSKIIHQAMILQARIEEIPSHLDWSLQRAAGVTRRSSLKLMQHTLSVLLSGFLFKPVLFFVLPGLLLLALSAYADSWVLIHTLEQYRHLRAIGDRDVTDAVAAAFRQAPHTFIIGGMTLMLAIQLISLGILSLQSKSYFEEIFYLGTSIYKTAKGRDRD